MRKLRTMLVVAVAAASLSIVPAGPAHASCDSEIGDWCKLLDVVCGTNPKVTQLVLEYCRN